MLGNQRSKHAFQVTAHLGSLAISSESEGTRSPRRCRGLRFACWIARHAWRTSGASATLPPSNCTCSITPIGNEDLLVDRQAAAYLGARQPE